MVRFGGLQLKAGDGGAAGFGGGAAGFGGAGFGFFGDVWDGDAGASER